jgi:nitrogen fixation negative regulator NifL
MTPRALTPDPPSLDNPNFRALVEQTPAIIWVADLDGRTTYVSPQVEHILGTPVDEWISDPNAWERRIHPDDRGRVVATMAAAQTGVIKYRCEYRLLAVDGRVVWVLDEAEPVRDAEGRPVAMQGVALDITERKQAEAEAASAAREMATLHRISEIVRVGRPLDDAYAEITAEVEALLGFQQSAIVLLDESRRRLVYKGVRGLPGVEGAEFEAELDTTFCGIVVRTGRPFVWTDGEPLPGPFPCASISHDTRAFVGVPMSVGGRVIGALGVGDRRPHPIDPRVVPVVGSIANHVGTLIERARAREALEASERHFHAAFDSAPDAMVVVDDDGICVAANPAAGRLYGAAVEQVLGRRLEIFAPRDTDAALDADPRPGGRAKSDETQVVRADGAVRLVEYAVTTNFVPGRHFALLRDVSERRQDEAERRVRAAAMAEAASGIVITDVEGRIEWTNPAFTRMSGYDLGDLRGRTPRVLKSGQHEDAFYARLWRTIRAGEVWRGEMINRRRDGSLYFEEQSITPVHMSGDPRSPITHFVAVKQDVTERKRSEEALRRSEEYHRSLLDNALDLIVVLDADATVRYASPSIERILGYRPHELIGTSTLDRLHPDDTQRVMDALVQGRATPGLTVSIEYQVRHKDGSYRILEAIASNLLDHPAVAGIIVNARDVTERRQSERAQQRLREHLRHSEQLAAMSELLAGVAHELNNPLAVVIGHSALLARATDPAVASRAEKIGRAAERCARLVKNFLALARQYPTERTSVSLNQVVHDAVEMVAYQLRVDDVEVVAELDNGLLPLAADSHQLQQVVVNLVTNAHQAMHGVTRPRRLTVRTGSGPAHTVWFEVTDTGPGIPPETQERVFEPFFTTKPVGKGTGLGLSISKNIVENHGGRIGVESTPGTGTTFRVELPLGTPSTPAAPSEQQPVTPKRRVLVVDDEAEVGNMASELLRCDGHQVDVASNGVEALILLRSRPYDTVLTDIKMPHLDGMGLWNAVKRDHPALAARFVFFTGDTLNATTAEFLERSGAPSFRKPFTLHDVRLALARVDDPEAGAARV